MIEYEKEKKYKKDDTLCLNIGFKLSEKDNENIYNKKNVTNIIMQLKEKNIISSYNFNLHFDVFKINGEIFDGFIVIGGEPHQYLKNSFNEYQLFKTLAFNKDNALSWDILFNKIFYLNSYKNEIIINKKIEFYNQATLSPSSSLIVGTNNYEDLFLEKNDLVYFLVIFYDFPEDAQNYLWAYISRWELGTPFMKKYFFTYDYDNKYIGFYNNKKIIQNNYNNLKTNNRNNILKIAICIIISIIICHFIRRRIFRNKKISAVELENNNINDSIVDKYNYSNVELEQNII